MSPAGRASFLLVVPALALGWLAGGRPHAAPPSPSAAPATKSGAARIGHAPSSALDLLDPAASGVEPHYLDVSLQILARAESATGTALARLHEELQDARFTTHPGYDLLRQAVQHAWEVRAPQSYLATIRSGAERRTFFLEWGARDLRAAFTAALHAPPPGQRAVNLQHVLHRGAGNDPALALELVRSIPDERLRSEVAHWALVGALQADPNRYPELATEFPDHATFVAEFAITEMARTDPALALTHLAEVPPAGRASAREGLLGAWSEHDLPAALQWARAHDVPLPQQLLRNWFGSDPVAALQAALAERPQPGSPANHIPSMLQEAESAQQNAIAAWLADLADESLRARLSSGLLQGSGPPPSPAVLDAARFAASHPNGDVRQLAQFAARIQDPQERRDWIGSLPPTVSRPAMAWHAGDWLRDEPAAFTQHVEAFPTRRARAFFFQQALENGNYEHRDALRNFATGAGIDLDHGNP